MKKILVYLIPLLLLIPAFGLRDYQRNHELRYINIVNDALAEGHYFTFYNDGMVYADKPPLYFWLLMGVKGATGQNIMWIEALFTLIPAIVILYIMNIWTFKKQSLDNILPPMTTLLTTGMFIASTMILRMDMMMAMFIVLSIYTFYKMFTGNSTPQDPYLFPIYIFLGIMSKGPVAFIVPIMTVVLFLLFERKIRTIGQYLGWRTWLILLPLCGLWFLGIYHEGGVEYLQNLIFNQTINRGINAFHHKQPFWFYFARIWMVAAPWILFMAVIFWKSIYRKMMDSDVLLRLYCTVIVSTFIMLSCASGKLDIYLLPAYPFMVYFSFKVLYAIKPDAWIKLAVAIPAVAILMAYPALFILADKTPVIPKNLFLIYFAALLLTAGGAYALWAIFRGNIRHAFPAIGGSILVVVFIASFYLPQFNQYIGLRTLSEKTEAVAKSEDIHKIAFYRFRGGENMDYYMDYKAERLTTPTQLYQLSLDTVPTLLLIQDKDVRRDKAVEAFLNRQPVLEAGNFKGYIIQKRSTHSKSDSNGGGGNFPKNFW